MRKLKCLSLGLIAGLSLPVFAQSSLEHCVIQEALPGQSATGAFFSVDYRGEATEIEAVEMPSIPARLELHRMVMKDGVMEMGLLENRRLEEGLRHFQKGGDHLMMLDIAPEALPRAGERHELRLRLANGEVLSCTAEVKSLTEILSAGSPSSPHSHHHH